MSGWQDAVAAVETQIANLQAQFGGVPQIVARYSFIARTSDISQALFTPLTDGTFRLSLYVNMSGNGTGQGSGVVHITFDDGSNAVNLTVSNLSGISPNVIKAICIPVRLRSGQALSLVTTMDAPINYNLYAVVEQLD